MSKKDGIATANEAKNHAPEAISELWRAFANQAFTSNEAFSQSILPFIMSRAADPSGGFGSGPDLGKAIERLAQGPQFADVWDIDRKMISAWAAWAQLRQRSAAYQAQAAAPWNETMRRFGEEARKAGSAADFQDWRVAFAVWSKIANEELLRYQRSETFLKLQRELLNAGLEMQARQKELVKTISEMIGLPTREEFDDLTRQITELRREVRHLARQAHDGDKA